MTGVPAHCPYCGLYFISRAIRNMNVSCPACNNEAAVIDGTFDFMGVALIINRASPKTLQIVEAMQAAVSAARTGSNENLILKRLRQHSPEFAELALKTLRKRGIQGFIFLLVLLLTNCSANIEQTLDRNKLFDQARVYITGDDPYPLAGNHILGQETHEQSQQPSRQQRRL